MAKGKSRFARWSALGLIVVAGCDGFGRESVEGKVTLDGQPLAQAHVIFYPVADNIDDDKIFFGLTDEAGHFVMHGRGGESEGVPSGKYRVTVTTAVAKPTDTETTPLPPERVPLKYRNNSLEFEVPEGGTKEASFELKSR